MKHSKGTRIGMLAIAIALVGALVFGVTALAQGPQGSPSQGQGYVDADGDGVCDHTGSGQGTGQQGTGFVDADGDGVCDNWVDEDGDGVNDNAPRPQDGTGKHLRRGGRMGR